MKYLPMILITALLASTGTATALKWSDRGKIDEATRAIDMANALASGPAGAIACTIDVIGLVDGMVNPRVVIKPGTQAHTNLLTALTNRINNDKTAAEAYLAANGVTND